MHTPASDCRYLVVGASHAGLEAATAIRLHDADSSLTLVTREPHLPYSPTVLPYVVSGHSKPERIALRTEAWFARERIAYRRGLALQALQPAERRAVFADGSVIGYEKLLLATGAAPAIPPVPGLETVRYHVLRTLDDALALRTALGSARRALVLGAGLVGMHAAENIARAGVAVTVVEMQSQVLPGYFDAEAAAMIQAAFASHGIELLLQSKVVQLAACGAGARAVLQNGRELSADLLLVATGVRAEMTFLAGTDIERDDGILVDDEMRTSAADVWAAGDVAQARGFFTGRRTVSAILPCAVEQGRIAGMAMSGDPGVRRYPGAVPLNTYHFFGQHAVSVGAAGWDGARSLEEVTSVEGGRYLKVTLQDNRLKGIFGINVPFDPGIMWQLILRQLDLSALKDEFLERPQQVGRRLMSQTWR